MMMVMHIAVKFATMSLLLLLAAARTPAAETRVRTPQESNLTTWTEVVSWSVRASQHFTSSADAHARTNARIIERTNARALVEGAPAILASGVGTAR